MLSIQVEHVIVRRHDRDLRKLLNKLLLLFKLFLADLPVVLSKVTLFNSWLLACIIVFIFLVISKVSSLTHVLQTGLTRNDTSLVFSL